MLFEELSLPILLSAGMAIGGVLLVGCCWARDTIRDGMHTMLEGAALAEYQRQEKGQKLDWHITQFCQAAWRGQLRVCKAVVEAHPEIVGREALNTRPSILLFVARCLYDRPNINMSRTQALLRALVQIVLTQAPHCKGQAQLLMRHLVGASGISKMADMDGTLEQSLPYRIFVLDAILEVIKENDELKKAFWKACQVSRGSRANKLRTQVLTDVSIVSRLRDVKPPRVEPPASTIAVVMAVSYSGSTAVPAAGVADTSARRRVKQQADGRRSLTAMMEEGRSDVVVAESLMAQAQPPMHPRVAAAMWRAQQQMNKGSHSTTRASRSTPPAPASSLPLILSTPATSSMSLQTKTVRLLFKKELYLPENVRRVIGELSCCFDNSALYLVGGMVSPIVLQSGSKAAKQGKEGRDCDMVVVLPLCPDVSQFEKHLIAAEMQLRKMADIEAVHCSGVSQKRVGHVVESRSMCCSSRGVKLDIVVMVSNQPTTVSDIRAGRALLHKANVYDVRREKVTGAFYVDDSNDIKWTYHAKRDLLPGTQEKIAEGTPESSRLLAFIIRDVLSSPMLLESPAFTAWFDNLTDEQWMPALAIVQRTHPDVASKWWSVWSDRHRGMMSASSAGEVESTMP